MASVTPIPEPETLDDVAPRLTRCMGDVIERLRNSGLEVETLETFLLDSSQHRIVVPCRLDGVPVEINFYATLPAWSDTICAHLQVLVSGGRRWSTYEPKTGFLVSRIVARIARELEAYKERELEAAEQADQEAVAAQRFADLASALGLSPDGLLVRDSNLEIQAFGPNQVRVTLLTSHAEALKIATEFHKPRRQHRKP